MLSADEPRDMQVEPIRDETSRMTAVPEKRRVRTDVWHLKQLAARRRRRANAVLVGSVGVVGVLVWALYALLTRI
jgi:hypothetical protein